MKKILLLFVLLITSIGVVKANTISSIDMDIYVDIEGTATVTETWVAKVNSGTEGWHPYFNLGNSKITLVEASMDGKEYSILDDWNENSSLSGKAYKAGLYHPESNEVDICFGITNYGSHTYKVKYTISNFVSTTEDSDIIYWTLFPYDFSARPDNVTIKIYSDEKFADTLDVWGYGKYGAPCYVYDGRIEMTSDGPLDSDEYLTILVKFEKGTFRTSNDVGNDFDYYYNMAEEGSTKYTGDNVKESFFDKIFPIFMNLLIWIPILIGVIASAKKNKKYDFGTTGNKVRKDVLAFRDIPCNKDIFRAYWVATNYNLTKKKEDFLGAVILKWLKNGNIRIEKKPVKKLFKDTEENNIVFVTAPVEVEQERKLYSYMYEASLDGCLESDEFKKWCKTNYKKILNWFDESIDEETRKLATEGKATPVVDGKVFKHTIYQINSCMMEDAEHMAGLKKFLKEFSAIDTREPIEVNLWNEYLMYAQIFGLAKEVADQFKKLYPEVIQDMERYGYNYNDVYFIHHITTTGIQSASAARQRAESYSSGGGGFSSGGGGGGSFGGGGGGGGFR